MESGARICAAPSGDGCCRNANPSPCDGQQVRARPLRPSTDPELQPQPMPGYARSTGRLSPSTFPGSPHSPSSSPRRGREGAEELARFHDLLRLLGADRRRAERHGGDVLKFRGDALLLLFVGERHPPRACGAASDMQQTIERVGNAVSSAGPFTLRMSAGVRTGLGHMFVMENPHRALIVSGPAATRVFELRGPRLRDGGRRQRRDGCRDRPLLAGLAARGRVPPRSARVGREPRPPTSERRGVGVCQSYIPLPLRKSDPWLRRAERPSTATSPSRSSRSLPPTNSSPPRARTRCSHGSTASRPRSASRARDTGSPGPSPTSTSEP